MDSRKGSRPGRRTPSRGTATRPAVPRTRPSHQPIAVVCTPDRPAVRSRSPRRRSSQRSGSAVRLSAPPQQFCAAAGRVATTHPQPAHGLDRLHRIRQPRCLRHLFAVRIATGEREQPRPGPGGRPAVGSGHRGGMARFDAGWAAAVRAPQPGVPLAAGPAWAGRPPAAPCPGVSVLTSGTAPLEPSLITASQHSCTAAASGYPTGHVHRGADECVSRTICW